MDKYLGVKMVHAAPALRLDDGKGDVRIELLGTNPMPRPGDAVDMGYKVVYEDGYESWSPQDVFEKAYRKVSGMSFGLAIEALKLGLAVARKGWNGKGIYLELQVPDRHSKMTLPYIYIVTCGLITDNPHAPKGRVPWLASQTDMLAEDWYVVEDEDGSV
jgi:hypothetical protein